MGRFADVQGSDVEVMMVSQAQWQPWQRLRVTGRWRS